MKNCVFNLEMRETVFAYLQAPEATIFGEKMRKNIIVMKLILKALKDLYFIFF